MLTTDHLTTDHLHVDPAVGAGGLRRLLWANGGFTLDHHTGRPLDQGIAVCADPAQTWSFPSQEWDDTRVDRWIFDQQSRLDEGDVHLGGWLQGEAGRVWLELVWVLPNRLAPAALAIARWHDQQAVFDLARCQLLALDRAVRRRDPR